jgi:cytochrome oxidase Cu insertion factor (SCO1/SenC/PrrC family)
LLLMFGIAGLSLGGASLLFYLSQSGVWGTTNNGTFVEPPQDATALQVVDGNGRPAADARVWWLWVVRDTPCDAACDQALHQLRQLHVLLNRDGERVVRALVSPTGTPDPALAEKYPGLKFLAGNTAALTPGIYIVDPIGNLVLRYPVETPGKAVLQDLKRLLKVSQIG